MSRREFYTPEGTPVPAVDAAEMREVDRVAVEEVGLPLLSMMENAGRTLAWHVRATREDERVVVLAGDGGNGGGGLACARHLVNRGVQVRIVLDRPPEALSGAAATQVGILDAASVPVASGPDALESSDDSRLVVDALVGYGLEGDLRGTARSLVEAVNGSPGPAVSLDVPSGVDATSGAVLGVAVDPDRTVTLALPKTGLDPTMADLYLADIGIPPAVYERTGIEYDRPFGDDDWVELVTSNRV